MVVHKFNSSTWEERLVGLCEFKASLVYIVDGFSKTLKMAQRGMNGACQSKFDHWTHMERQKSFDQLLVSDLTSTTTHNKQNITKTLN